MANEIQHVSVGTTMTQAEYEAVNSHSLASGLVIPKIVLKAADETVNNSDVLQNDDELLFAIAANEVWGFTFVIAWNSGTTPDIKFALAVPALATFAAAISGGDGAGNDVRSMQVSGTALSLEGSAAEMAATIIGRVVNGANAGNLQLQWAQTTANASDTIVRANSYIIAHKLA